MSPDESNFFVRLAQRDEDAWQQIIDEMGPVLKNVIRKTLIDNNLSLDYVDEVEQKTWIDAYNNFNRYQFQNRKHLFKWISKAQFFHVSALNREAGRLPLHDDEPDDELLIMPDEMDTRPVETVIIERETAEQRQQDFNSALALLLEEFKVPLHQEIVIRCIRYGESPEQVAEIYHLDVNDVTKVRRRALTKMQRYVQAASFFIQVANKVKGK